MFYDELALFEAECARVQRRSAVTSSPHLNIRIASKIEMIIAPWYLDEFGNQTRQIKAREQPGLRSTAQPIGDTDTPALGSSIKVFSTSRGGSDVRAKRGAE